MLKSFLLAIVVGVPTAEQVVGSAKDLNVAMTSAKAGDVFVLSEGTWLDADLLLQGEGTAEAPIVVRAKTPGKTILSGRIQVRIAGKHVVVEGLYLKDGRPQTDELIAFRSSANNLAENCRLTQCVVEKINPSSSKHDSKWVNVYGVSNRVDHCSISGKVDGGTTMVVWLDEKGNQPGLHRIDHNYFGTRQKLGKNGGETIRIGDSKTSLVDAKCVVEDNLFEECSGEIEIISVKSCSNTVRNNTFLRCEGAVTMRHGNRCLVEGNRFFGEGARRTGGVRVIGADHKIVNNLFVDLKGEDGRAALSMMNGIPDSKPNGYFQVQRAIVAFNTFVNCEQTLCLGIVGDNPKGGVDQPEDCIFANNIFWSKAGPMFIFQTTPGRTTWESNLVFGNTEKKPEDPGLVVADPKLALGDDKLWRPQAGSPAIGAATGDFAWVTTDIAGQARPEKKDIGCTNAVIAATPDKPADPPGASWFKPAVKK